MFCLYSDNMICDLFMVSQQALTLFSFVSPVLVLLIIQTLSVFIFIFNLVFFFYIYYLLWLFFNFFTTFEQCIPFLRQNEREREQEWERDRERRGIKERERERVCAIDRSRCFFHWFTIPVSAKQGYGRLKPCTQKAVQNSCIYQTSNTSNELTVEQNHNEGFNFICSQKCSWH